MPTFQIKSDQIVTYIHTVEAETLQDAVDMVEHGDSEDMVEHDSGAHDAVEYATEGQAGWDAIPMPWTDTERTNMQRALEAKVLCAKMEDLTGCDDLTSQVSDIMTHLMHLCRLIRNEDDETISFDSCLETARINFEAEVFEDSDV